MFVMLSVRTTSVCERHNKVTTTTTTTANTTTSKATNTYSTHTTQSQDSAISSLTTQFDNLLINKNSIEKIFTKSVSFDKNINQSNLSLTQPNNLKEPPAQQVIYKLHSLFGFTLVLYIHLGIEVSIVFTQFAIGCHILLFLLLCSFHDHWVCYGI